jgi:pimeloyl-ACP methyl ester carboxylesterase
MNRKEKRPIPKRRWLWMIGGIFLVVVGWHLVANIFQEDEKRLRQRFRETVKETFPEQAAKFSQTVGLSFVESDPDAPKRVDLDRKSIVLIHGLDDPGKVWQNLAPELVKEGFNVWLMHYPNDQPIVESAELFFKELQKLRQRGISRIALVAHSMGGLVSREMLTSPDIDYSRFLSMNLVPEIATLIMVGTPNHGSQLARFRMFAEVRDQVVRMTTGDANWLGFILDGAGEAKIDLLPDSRFLTALNQRPHPAGVELFIIAGITSSWNENDLQRWMDKLSDKVSEDHQKRLDEIGQQMIAMTHVLGDGLVTVESARLDGVPHQTVSGTHLSMIRNVTLSSQRVPPAVPIIVDRLKKLE